MIGEIIVIGVMGFGGNPSYVAVPKDDLEIILPKLEKEGLEYVLSPENIEIPKKISQDIFLIERMPINAILEDYLIELPKPKIKYLEKRGNNFYKPPLLKKPHFYRKTRF